MHVQKNYYLQQYCTYNTVVSNIIALRKKYGYGYTMNEAFWLFGYMADGYCGYDGYVYVWRSISIFGSRSMLSCLAERVCAAERSGQRVAFWLEQPLSHRGIQAKEQHSAWSRMRCGILLIVGGLVSTRSQISCLGNPFFVHGQIGHTCRCCCCCS